MKAYYVVLCEYCIDGEGGVDIISVKESMKEAIDVYNNQKEIEERNAENNAYSACDDGKYSVVWYEEGNYNEDHISLYIQMIKC